MNIKKIVIIGTALVLLAATITAAAPLTAQDKEQLKWLFGSFESYVNQGNTQGIVSLFSPNMPADRKTALTNDIYARIASGGVRLSFFPNLSDESIKEIKPDVLYEVSGTFSAEGPQWNVSGMSATFTVERIGGMLYIYDTNIIEKMSPAAVFKTVGLVFIIIVVIFLLGLVGLVIVVVLIVRSQKKKKAVVGTGEGPGTV
jgi:flagellar basal body-associated protein FliL